MPRIQAYISDEVAQKINSIVAKRRAEGARERDISSSSISAMLLELGLRVYEVQLERKESPFNQMEYNRIMLENVVKTQSAISKVLGICSLAPYVDGNEKFEFSKMVNDILRDARLVVDNFFPGDSSED